MQKQPSPRKSYMDKGPLRRRFAFLLCTLRRNHPFVELERARVETIGKSSQCTCNEPPCNMHKWDCAIYGISGTPRQVFYRNKLVCRECGYET